MEMLDCKDGSCLKGYIQINAAAICLNLCCCGPLGLHVHMTTYPLLPAHPQVVVFTRVRVAALGTW